MGKRKDHSGIQYNSWTALQYIGPDKRSKDAIWKCRCKCGAEKELKINNLVSGRSKQCPACALKPKVYKDVLPVPMWNLILRRGIAKHGNVDITREQAEELFIEQKGKCALSGLPIQFAKYGNDYLARNQTASLDRIDSSKPYEVGNVQWVHKIINLMKNTLEQTIFINMCRSVADHHGKSDR